MLAYEDIAETSWRTKCRVGIHKVICNVLHVLFEMSPF